MPMTCDLIDVFCDGPLSGNPLAVVHNAGDLSAEQMLALTQWLGFSETTFVLPPTDERADYRVRIFYPGGELPFAGHPTLGSCFAWLQSGGRPAESAKIVQECEIGLVEIQQRESQFAFKAPDLLRYEPLTEEECREAIQLTGIDETALVEAVHVSNGPQWQLLRLRNAEDVLAANPSSKAALGTDIGLAGPHRKGGRRDWELRAFFADAMGRFVEDPVTGSFNAGVAMHLFASGLAEETYRAGQGQKIGADGLVVCRRTEGGDVWVGGSCRAISLGGVLEAFD
ncbi:MAG: PhzF family phenazine biosynthesis protein [Erythrobacter sp.]|nr:PhzF family phenazine biosynthesis protein [Erythrobacter sp.]